MPFLPRVFDSVVAVTRTAELVPKNLPSPPFLLRLPVAAERAAGASGSISAAEEPNARLIPI